jgi:hypothetical protein
MKNTNHALSARHPKGLWLRIEDGADSAKKDAGGGVVG